MNFTGLAALIFSAAALGGCASIVNGTTEKISVQTLGTSGPLADSQCSLANNFDTWVVTTPGDAVVHRSSQALGVKCMHDGYLPAAETVSAGTSSAVYGNILLGGGLGATMDTVNGAAWTYPKQIVVTLQPARTASAAGANAAESKD